MTKDTRFRPLGSGRRGEDEGATEDSAPPQFKRTPGADTIGLPHRMKRTVIFLPKPCMPGGPTESSRKDRAPWRASRTCSR